MAGMFKIDQDGQVTRSDVGAGSHEARVIAGVPLPGDFDNLTEESRVASLLLPDIVANSLAPSTASSYAANWSKFERWCQANGRQHLPASPDTVRMYLAKLCVQCRTMPPVLAARSSICYYSKLYNPDQMSPTDSDVVVTVVKGLKRKFSNPIAKKKPVTPDVVRRCLEKMTEPSLRELNLVQLRNLAMFSVQYFAAARYEEAANLYTENVMVSLGGNLEILFLKSKTNQYKGARSAFLTPHQGAGKLDPCKLIILYRNMLERAGGSEFFFPSFTGKEEGKSNVLYCTCMLNCAGARVPIAGSKIKYSNWRAIFRGVLRSIGLSEQEIGEYGVHSMRSGSATAASWGVTELELQQHGRWKTREAAVSYVQRTEAQYARVPSLLLEQVLAV